ncbi:ABC transporter ATP-binding/permease protein [methanogenic archaeon mixed culture ISO4-G1]|nr:ABC transporter ATP-binding/permease protein [methanogenic archaeon mixed culture ISO4-G1]
MASDERAHYRAPLRKFFSLVGEYRLAIILTIIFSTLGALTNTLGPPILADISNIILDGISVEGTDIDFEAITQLALILIALYVFSTVSTIIFSYYVQSTGLRIANRLRAALMRKLDNMPLSYFDRTNTGDLMSRLTNDTDVIGEESGRALNSLVRALSTIVLTVILMFWMSPILSIVTLIPPITSFLLMRYIIRHTQKYFKRQSVNLGEINTLVEETYSGYAVVRSYDLGSYSVRKFTECNDRLFDSAYRARFISSALPQFVGFMNNMSYVLVCMVGMMLAMNGSIKYGVIVAFILYSKTLGRPMELISEALSTLQSVAASVERISSVLDAPELPDEKDKADTVPDIEGHVEFRDVCFGYSEYREIIHGLSFDAPAGSKIAIVGQTGAGKTTVVNLLMRFYEPDSGKIYIDGIPADSMTRKSVHSMFSMVLQDTWLFRGTIRENLVFNREGITDAQMEAACRIAGIHNFIESLPDGYDSILDETTSISAGQRQQMTIARAILKDAPMIIFDEATSSIDTHTEKRIQEAMDRLMDGHTSFIIAHRLSTIKNADQILVMRDGRIVEKGKHDELLSLNGFYRDLYDSQFEGCD